MELIRGIISIVLGILTTGLLLFIFWFVVKACLYMQDIIEHFKNK